MNKTIKDVVAWIMFDEKIIKLQKADKVFSLDDKVIEFMKKTGLNEDDGYEVEVDIKDFEEEDGNDSAKIYGTVVKLKTSKGESSEKENPKETKEEVKKDENEYKIIKELTVAGVSTKNRSVTFKEEDKVWYNLSEEIDAEKVKTEFTKKKVSVSIAKSDKGNDVITSVATVGPEESTEKDTNVSSTNNDSYEINTQKSIEAQVAVEHAQILAGKLAESGKLTLTEVNDFVDNRAKRNYELMQEVKKSV